MSGMGRYLPPQHGAWAFLAFPLVLGTATAPWTPVLVLLALAWVAAHPLSYAAFGLVRARHPARFRGPFVLWAAVVLAGAAPLLAWRPWLIWIAPVYVAGFAVNLRHAARNDERALVNDLVFALECAGMVPVTWAVGAGDRSWTPPDPAAAPAAVWVSAVVCALVLFGSVLHVKSLIRQRRDVRYARGSRAFAVLSALVAAGLAAARPQPGGVLVTLAFGVLVLRAFLVGRASMRPGRIGMVELGCFSAVAVSCVIAT